MHHLSLLPAAPSSRNRWNSADPPDSGGTLPPDTIKPLAESTLGDIVVLTQRLGMNWRTLNLDEGFMQADGNGLSISSTEVKGLGIVFKFSKSGSTGPFPRVVPSIATDKLLCKLLLGHPALVGRDFDMIRYDRSVVLNHDQDGLFFQDRSRKNRFSRNC